jgi:hypothetical protein
LDGDADSVRVARHALHEITSRVAAQTQGWQLDEQERLRLLGHDERQPRVEQPASEPIQDLSREDPKR